MKIKISLQDAWLVVDNDYIENKEQYIDLSIIRPPSGTVSVKRDENTMLASYVPLDELIAALQLLKHQALVSKASNESMKKQHTEENLKQPHKVTVVFELPYGEYEKLIIGNEDLNNNNLINIVLERGDATIIAGGGISLNELIAALEMFRQSRLLNKETFNE